MTVAVDIGNTDIVVGCYQQGWKHIFRVSSQVGLEAIEYERRFRAFFLEGNIKLSDYQCVIISSVVPDLTATIEEIFEKLFAGSIQVIDGAFIAGLSLGNIDPFELGADLAANAVAAHHRYQQKVIVVDFGTALTFTVVSDVGHILGVSIAPGVGTAMKSLSSNTARLPEIPLEIPDKVMGNNTIEALQAGIMHGYSGLVRHMVELLKNEIGGHPKVIATGGLSFIFKPLHDLFDELDIHLTLEGLRIMASHLKK